MRASLEGSSPPTAGTIAARVAQTNASDNIRRLVETGIKIGSGFEVIERPIC
jgi:hypothetical protein